MKGYRTLTLLLLASCGAESPVVAPNPPPLADAGEVEGPSAAEAPDAASNQPDAPSPTVLPKWVEVDDLLKKGFLPASIVGDSRHAGRLVFLSSASVGPVVALWDNGTLTVGPSRTASFPANVEEVGVDGTGRAVLAGTVVNATTRSILSIKPDEHAWRQLDLPQGIPPGVSSGPAFVFVNPGPGGHVLLGRAGQYLKDISGSLDNGSLDLFSAPTLATPPAARWLRWSSADATLFAGEDRSIARCVGTAAYACDAPVSFPAGVPRQSAVLTTPADPKAVFVLSDQIHGSSDGGKTFVARELPPSPNTSERGVVVSTVAPSKLVFFAASARFSSSDSGATWKPLPFPPGACVAPAFDGAGTLYTECAGKLYATTLP